MLHVPDSVNIDGFAIFCIRTDMQRLRPKTTRQDPLAFTE